MQIEVTTLDGQTEIFLCESFMRHENHMTIITETHRIIKLDNVADYKKCT